MKKYIFLLIFLNLGLIGFSQHDFDSLYLASTYFKNVVDDTKENMLDYLKEFFGIIDSRIGVSKNIVGNCTN